MDIADHAEELAKGVVQAQGLELVHVEFLPKGRSSLLRLYIDKPGGVSVDDCQRVSRHLSLLLEVEDFIDQHYILEVSSPGIERPLFKAEDYRRFSGKEIRLVTHGKIEGRKNFTGLLKGFSEGIVDLECQGVSYRIPLQEVKKANLVYRF
jgi:ribosome maturation factor RimP